MKTAILVLICVSSLIGCKDNPVAPDISGTWDFTYTAAFGGYSGVMTVSGKGSNTSATLTGLGTLPVSMTGSVSDTEVNLTGGGYLLTATLNSDKSRMDGVLQHSDSHYPFKAIRR